MSERDKQTRLADFVDKHPVIDELAGVAADAFVEPVVVGGVDLFAGTVAKIGGLCEKFASKFPSGEIHKDPLH